ncbi:MAG: hypothetical protein JWO25_1848 [Alphaproteobacteria bacterium]|nr:hypothetical protein [Alphaproteobacteria bacterium]
MTHDPKLVRLMRRIVRGMEPLTREVFLMNSLAERDYADIADWLGITAGEVEERLAEAILEICRGLRDDAGPGR